MKNLAISPNSPRENMLENDTHVTGELTQAGIQIEGPFEFLREKYESRTALVGILCSWTFERAWRYYIAEGPGIPPDKAEEFHKTWGGYVRVAGHCGCPSPLEYYKGFAVGLYHIDSQEGLNAFAKLLKSIYIEDETKTKTHKTPQQTSKEPILEGENTGHGWVNPRPDGFKARCGGPLKCGDCADDLQRKLPPKTVAMIMQS